GPIRRTAHECWTSSLPQRTNDKEKVMGQSTVTRRRFVITSLIGTADLRIIAACAGAPPSSPTAAPAAQPTTAPAAPAAAPTAAPTQAAAPTAAPAATTAAAATSAPAAAAPAGQATVQLRIHDWEQDPDNVFYGPLF